MCPPLPLPPLTLHLAAATVHSFKYEGLRTCAHCAETVNIQALLRLATFAAALKRSIWELLGCPFAGTSICITPHFHLHINKGFSLVTSRSAAFLALRPPMGWHAVVMLAWAGAAGGADMGDAESARAARIELLKDENAKMVRTIEKVRGALSHWATLGFVPGVGASSAEDEGPAASAGPAGDPGPGRRLESKVPDGVKVWRGESCTTSRTLSAARQHGQSAR